MLATVKSGLDCIIVSAGCPTCSIGTLIVNPGNPPLFNYFSCCYDSTGQRCTGAKDIARFSRNKLNLTHNRGAIYTRKRSAYTEHNSLPHVVIKSITIVNDGTWLEGTVVN
jgi:hypothetical protein